MKTFLFDISFMAIVLSALHAPNVCQAQEPIGKQDFFSSMDFDGDGEISKSEILSQASSVDLVVGARGHKLQMTLNSMFYVSKPVKNISYKAYKQFIDSNYVDVAVPLCLGDSLEGFRVVGTNSLMLEGIPAKVDKNGDAVKFAFKDGTNFQDDNFFGAVVGHIVAQALQLKVGDTFKTSHGTSGALLQHDHPFTVTGVLKESGTPHDRAVFVNMEGFYLQEGHALVDQVVDSSKGDTKEKAKNADKPSDAKLQPLPESQREVTVVLVMTSKDDEFGVFKTIIPIKIDTMAKEAQAICPLATMMETLESKNDVAKFYALKEALSTGGDNVKQEEFRKLLYRNTKSEPRLIGR